MYPIIDKKATGNRIKGIMELKNISVKDLKEYLGLSCVQSIYHWLDGTCLPTIDNLYAMRQLFGTTVDAMICGNRRTVVLQEMDARNRRLYEYYVRLAG